MTRNKQHDRIVKIHWKGSKMLNDDMERIKEEEGILNRLRQITPSNMVVAFRAKMTNYEILLCQEISMIRKLPLVDVLLKMELFKQSSEHLLYKKDFSVAV